MLYISTCRVGTGDQVIQQDSESKFQYHDCKMVQERYCKICEDSGITITDQVQVSSKDAAVKHCCGCAA